MFRARLAQYQIRRAQDAGRTDHRSYLDLGAAYAGMGLRVEAVRELTEALTGALVLAINEAMDGGMDQQGWFHAYSDV